MKVYYIYWRSASEGFGANVWKARNALAAARSFSRQFRTRCVIDVVAE